jgi:hypothetical protein
VSDSSSRHISPTIIESPKNTLENTSQKQRKHHVLEKSVSVKWKIVDSEQIGPILVITELQQPHLQELKYWQISATLLQFHFHSYKRGGSSETLKRTWKLKNKTKSFKSVSQQLFFSKEERAKKAQSLNSVSLKRFTWGVNSKI